MNRPTPSAPSVLAVLAVLVGGILGSGARLAVDIALPAGVAGMPVGTLAINVVGSFLLGLVVSSVWRRVPEWLRAGMGAGFLGSFTTFSAVMATAVAQLSHQFWQVLVYVALSLLLGLVAAWLGLAVGKPEPLDVIHE